MNQNEIIKTTADFVKITLEDAEGGHDWFHTERVWKNAKLIAQTESVDLLVVELAALLHDIADAKFYHGDESIGAKKAKNFLEAFQLEEEVVQHVEQIILNISFKGGNTLSKFYSDEFAVVQDADRLDALGAIGIARTFNYGGFKNRALYDPNIPPQMNMTKEEYRQSTAPTINHFYEKLFLLRDRMHTQTAKKIAEKRHDFMEMFLEQFYQEWAGNL